MIKKIGTIKFIALVILCFLISFSCNYSKKEAKAYLPGEYFYEIPSGEVQILTINPDFTFKQIVYSEERKNILYKNEGKLQVDGADILFENWLECYELAAQKMLSSPYLASSFRGAYWTKEKGTKDILIVAFDQTNYVFRKKEK
jgi:hypothetical protein